MQNRTVLLSIAAVVIVGAAGYVFYERQMGLTIRVPGNEGSAPVDVRPPDNPLPPPSQPKDSIRTSASGTQASNRALESFLSIKARAEKGEPAAQRELAEAYGRCIPVNMNPERYVASIDALAALSKSPGNADALKRTGRAAAADCTAVDNGAAVPMEAYNLWLAQAAKQGDLAAQAKLYMNGNGRPQGAELKNFMDQVVASNDPNAIFELGQLIESNSSPDGTGPYSNVSAQNLSGYAWSIAACRQGLDCGAGSQVMRSLCLNTTACTSPNYESYVRDYMVSAGDAALLNSKVEEVLSLLPKTKR